MSSAASAAQEHFLQYTIQWASLALLYYDYILTFPTEVRLIWKSDKLKVSTLLYVLYRYALLANVLYLLAISNKFGSNCDAWYKAISIVSVLGRAAVIFTFLMRTYAVYNKNKIILVVLGALGLACFILDCMHVPGLKCHGSSSSHLANTLLSILICVFEASATILTFLRGMQALRFGGGSLAVKKHTLEYLIIEQGVLYFGLVSVFTIGTAVLNYRASGFPQRLLNAITLPLSGMLTARFLLRIRAFSRNRDPLGGDRSTQQDFSSFAVTSNPAAAGGRARRRRGHGGYSLTDEFGEDPYSVVFRAVDSVTQASNVSAGQTASANSADEDGRRGAVVAEFLGEMRRRLEDEDEADEPGDGLTSTSGTEFDEEKKQRTVGTVATDVEVGDRHGSGSEIVEVLKAEESKESISGGSALGKED